MNIFGLYGLNHENFWNTTHNFKNNHKNTKSSEMIKSRFRNPSPEIQISKFKKFEIKFQLSKNSRSKKTLGDESRRHEKSRICKIIKIFRLLVIFRKSQGDSGRGFSVRIFFRYYKRLFKISSLNPL